MKDHKDLIVWQKSMLLVIEIYKLVRFLPKEETYGLSDQMRRAAVSIPSNISEGNSRESKKEFLHFLSIAQGSNAEIETQLLICQQLGLIQSEKLKTAFSLNEEISKMLRSLILAINH